jgi:uncharacterized protein (TIGR02597 family)
MGKVLKFSNLWVGCFLFLAGCVSTNAVRTPSSKISVSTIPDGTLNVQFDLAKNSINYLSLPLIDYPVYTGTVSSVTAKTIVSGDRPEPWKPNDFVPTEDMTPYFVKFLSGQQKGRVLLVTANTANTLTLDTTDRTAQTVSLTTTGFSVDVGDSYEIFSGETLASLAGDNTSDNPVLVTGGANPARADTVNIYDPQTDRNDVYFFNSNLNYWEKVGTRGNANNTIVYPYSTLSLLRHGETTSASIEHFGRVPEVPLLIKTAGLSNVSYGGGNIVNLIRPTYFSGYPVDMTFSQLAFGPHWAKSNVEYSADCVALWNPTLLQFQIFYQDTNSVWHEHGSPAVNQNNFVIHGGSTMAIIKRSPVSGANSFISLAMPYAP